MNLLIRLILTIGFILSCTGLLLWAKQFLKVPFCFVPAFVISFVTVIVYFGGILNILFPTACFVYVIGIILFVWLGIIHHKNISTYLKHLHLLDICFVIGSIPFITLLLHEHLQHYDNFTHWALIVKVLLTNNAFPTASNALVEFTNYPIGTSSLLYYFGTFLGHSDGVFLLGQGLLIFSLFYAIFGVISKPKCFLLVAFLGTGLSTLSFFNLTIRINNLLVDFILPILTLACWAVIFRYKDQPKKELLLLLPLQALLLIIKATGILYFSFVLILWIIQTIQVRSSWKFSNIMKAIGTSIASLSTYLAWEYHTVTVFANVENKFSTSTLAMKSSEEMHTIINTFIHSSLDITTRPFLGFLISNLVIIALYIGIRIFLHQNSKKLVHALVLLDLMVIIYYIGILALYLFSMPLDEALTLAGFERYASSIIDLYVGGLVLNVTLLLQDEFSYTNDEHILYRSPKEKQNYQKAILVCISIMILILTSEYNGIISIDSSYDTSLAYTMKSVVKDHWTKEDDEHKYLLYGSDHDGQMTSYYFQYLAKYYLYASHIDAVCTFYEPNLENLLSSYDYLVVVEPDQQEENMLNKHFHVDGTTGFYHITKNNDSITLEKESNA